MPASQPDNQQQPVALITGAARRIVKPGHVLSRIHVDDIAAVLRASMARPRAGAVYNVCDDRPASGGTFRYLVSAVSRPR